MTILNYDNSRRQPLADRMVDYMAELGSDIPEDIVRGKLSDFIDRQCSLGILRISLAVEEDTLIGFSVYQIDQPESDWYKRPGWGFIREFYIAPEFRCRNYGRQLAQHTEQALREMGAENLYLTSGDGIPFWQRCGWRLTEETCSNDLRILEKE